MKMAWITTCANEFMLIISNGYSISLEEVGEREVELVVDPDLSRLRRIHVSLIKFLFRALSVVLSLLHVVLNPIHQFALRLSSVALSCSGVVAKCTLVSFGGFVAVRSLIGEILSHSIVHPSLETFFPVIPPKTRIAKINYHSNCSTRKRVFLATVS